MSDHPSVAFRPALIPQAKIKILKPRQLLRIASINVMHSSLRCKYLIEKAKMQYEADEPWHVICIQDPPPKGLPEGGLYDASLPDGPAEGENRRG